ncbi:hypothetical protein EES43_10190 [Streptomyces sp. ADI96-02]|uniref:hypothetical protein n=1 Tax=unclassified Streptomyces TaxID=2593676 RepID=UPI000F54F9B4|nr:hypothetical protein [Streptomyces sp. ADI96-02]RPK64225.1 hypothetical protein EES43_10190 [Streptomyces sp. ADI96-02]
MRKKLHWALCGTLPLLVSTACAGEDSGKERETLSASQVCDSTLTPRSAKALERLAATERFTELVGTNKLGEPYTFSLKRAAKRLHNDVAERNKCSIYKADDDSGIPLMMIDFTPERDHPDPAEQSGEGARLLFPMGAYADADDENGTYLNFSCPTSGPDGTSPYVAARMWSSSSSRGQDRMAVLNDVSRALAKQLGCADKAALPAQVPEPSTS